MSETKYLKCPCQKCGEFIEFPAHGIGSGVTCPHCGERTSLFASPVAPSSIAAPASEVTPAPLRGVLCEPTDEQASTSALSIESAEAVGDLATAGRKSRSRALPAVISAVVLIVISGALFVFRDKFTGSEPADSKGLTAAGARQVPAGKDSEPTQTVSPASASKTPKSLDDLKVGAITLEKAKGSSLVYAVGVLRNESDHQRFGVNVEVGLADAKGAKAGVAKDYRSVIEPREEWRFRALVLDTKAVSAKLSKVREEE